MKSKAKPNAQFTVGCNRQKAHELIDRLPRVRSWKRLAYEFALRGSIEAGLADIEAGRLVDGDEVMRWVKSWGTDHELPAPQPPPGRSRRR